MARFHEPAFNASDMGDTDDDLRHEHEIESENLADQLEEQQADEAVGPLESVDDDGSSGHGSDAQYYAGFPPFPVDVAQRLEAAQDKVDQRRARELQAKLAADNSEAGDDLESAAEPLTVKINSVHPPSPRGGEVPMRVQPMLTKISTGCANPDATHCNMEHFRNTMMIDIDPNGSDPCCPKKYNWATRGTRDVSAVKDDGSAIVIVQKMRHVLASCESDNLLPSESGRDHNSITQQMSDVDSTPRVDLDHDALIAAAHSIDSGDAPQPEAVVRTVLQDIDTLIQCEDADWRLVEIRAHMPMMCLDRQTDDRALGPQVGPGMSDDVAHSSGAYAVTERKELVHGRDRWRCANPQERVLKTELCLEAFDPPDPKNAASRRHLRRSITFKFTTEGAPIVEIYEPLASWRLSFTPNTQPFAALMDFSQYSERELAEVRPADYVPSTTLVLVAAFAADGSHAGEPLQLAALIKHVGPKIRYDGGKFWTWTGGSGWKKHDPHTEVTIAVRAAESELVQQLLDLTARTDFETLYYMAISKHEIHVMEDQLASIKKKAKSFSIVPKSDRGLASFINQLIPWVIEHGFAKSFERCKDIAFNNGVQQMCPPFAFRAETPDDRVFVRFPCDLPQAPTSEEQKITLRETALEPLLDLFQDRAVALREADKFACLLSGTCAVMPEANFRPMVGPFDPVSGRYATRCGKNTLLTLMKTMLGAAIDDSLPASFLSMVMEPGKSYSELSGSEQKLGHWVDEAEAQQIGASGAGQIRPWGSLPKKMWTGGGATDFAYRREYEQSQAYELRTNALMVSANVFNIGSQPDIWSKLEPTPFPRVADIPENKELIESGVPSFELDPSKVDSIKAMDSITRGKYLRYLIDRCIAIKKDPKAAHPRTPAHDEAKQKLKDVAGGVKAATVLSEGDAFDELRERLNEWLTPCTPTGDSMDAHMDAELAPRRKRFQLNAPYCFCGKKPAAHACSFTVSVVAAKLKIDAPDVYNFYVKQPTHLSKLTSAIQQALNLEPCAIKRARTFHRDAIFGWTFGSKEAEADAVPSCSSATVPQSDDETSLLKPTPGYKHTVPATGCADMSVAKPPVAKKPVDKQPVAKKPVAKKPIAKKPVAKKPMRAMPPRKKQKHETNEDDDGSESGGSSDGSDRSDGSDGSQADGICSGDESPDDSNDEQSEDEASMSGDAGSDNGSTDSSSEDDDPIVKAGEEASAGSDDDA